MEFKDKLKQTRIECGMTRRELSNRCGISNRTIQSYELGVRTPSFDSVLKLADALDVNPAEFIEYIPCFNRIVEIYKNEIQEET